MTTLCIADLPRAERQDAAIKEAVRTCGKRLRIAPFDREVGAQCAVNAWRAGSSPASAVARGMRYLRAISGRMGGAP